MGKLTENDKVFGPITCGKSQGEFKSISICSGNKYDDDEKNYKNQIGLSGFGYAVRIYLPRILRPLTSTKFYLDCNGEKKEYKKHYHREYGFTLGTDGYISFNFGPQDPFGDFSKYQKSFTMPWCSWRFVRKSVFDAFGKEFHRSIEMPKLGKDWRLSRYEEERQAVEKVSKQRFKLIDYDGIEITATTHIEEREWRLGRSWCSWLSLFRKPLIRRSLEIQFDKETGPEKGSWKGGTLRHGIEMDVLESHEQAMRRYCEKEHRSKYRTYKMKFVRKI